MSIKYIKKEGLFIKYTSDIIKYEKDIIELTHSNTEILPEDNDTLMKHITGFSLYLDDKMEEVFRGATEKFSSSSSSSSSSSFLTTNEDSSHDSYYDRIIEMSGGVIDTMLGIVWEWHNIIRGKNNGIIDKVLFYCVMDSWICFCRYFYLFFFNKSELLQIVCTRKTEEYPFCRMIEKEYNVIVSDDSVINYTLSELWDNLRFVIPTLYNYRFSYDMKEYIYALFFKYCDFIVFGLKIEDNFQNEDDGIEDNNNLNSPSSIEKIQTIYNNPLFVEINRKKIADKKRSIISKRANKEYDNDDDDDDYSESESYGGDEDDEDEDDDSGDENNGYDKNDEEYNVKSFQNRNAIINDLVSLKSQFFTEGRILVHPQIYRIMLIDRLEGLLHNKNDNFVYPQVKHSISEEWFQMINIILNNQELKGFIGEEYDSLFLEMCLFHGERERYRIKHPEFNDAASDILAIYRSNDNLEAMELKEVSTKEIISVFFDEQVKNLKQSSSEKCLLCGNISIEKNNEKNNVSTCGNGVSGGDGGGGGSGSSDKYNDFRKELNKGYKNKKDYCYCNRPDPRKKMKYEKECLLVTMISTMNLFIYNQICTKEEFKSVFILEELVELEVIDRIVYKFEDLHETCNEFGTEYDHIGNDSRNKKNVKNTRNTNSKRKKSIPFFIKLMGFYYVIDNNYKGDGDHDQHNWIYPKKYFIFRSLYLVESYMVWIAICVRKNIIKLKKLFGQNFTLPREELFQ